MGTLWEQVTAEMVDHALQNAAFVEEVSNGTQFVVNRTAVKSIIVDFIEQNLESYDFKKPTR